MIGAALSPACSGVVSSQAPNRKSKGTGSTPNSPRSARVPELKALLRRPQLLANESKYDDSLTGTARSFPDSPGKQFPNTGAGPSQAFRVTEALTPPSGRFSSSRTPLCSSTIFRHTASPRPVPVPVSSISILMT